MPKMQDRGGTLKLSALLHDYKWTALEEHIAKTIYEAKYRDSSWEKLHPRRLVRIQRLIEARAVLVAMELK